MGTTIYIDSDHNGYELKHALESYLRHGGYDVVDVGPIDRDPNDDYPMVASRVVNAMRGNQSENVLGSSFAGVDKGFALLQIVSKVYEARYAGTILKQNLHAMMTTQIFCVCRRIWFPIEKAKTIAHIFFSTAFAGAPRYKRRIEQLDELA